MLARQERRRNGGSLISIISSKYKMMDFPLIILAILINELQDDMNVNEAN